MYGRLYDCEHAQFQMHGFMQHNLLPLSARKVASLGKDQLTARSSQSPKREVCLTRALSVYAREAPFIVPTNSLEGE